MFEDEWVLIDTETNGLKAPIYTVDLAAQLMRGWEPVGDPFHKLLNQNIDIPPEASRVNGYTREILERDGEPAEDVYKAFKEYVNGRPICAYNLDYDWDKVLVPEWKRLGIEQIGKRGFCAFRLTQRLLDPVPAGNCKLQTLRQFYRLPERGAHSAMGDVMTVCDLIRAVLMPLINEANLDSYASIEGYLSAEWFPTRLLFGKYKGRSFKEASVDSDLYGWLVWLSESKQSHHQRMGAWYLNSLEEKEVPVSVVASAFDHTSSPSESRGEVRTGIVLYKNLEQEKLTQLITAARERLTDLEVIIAREKNLISVTQWKIFELLKNEYRYRDSLRIVIRHREQFIRFIIGESSLDDDDIFKSYKDEQEATDSEYEEAETLAKSQKLLSEDDQAELKSLFRKLQKLYHPDRHMADKEKYIAYTNLSKEINKAKDNSDIETLKMIAKNPGEFLRKFGLDENELDDEFEIEKLMKLYASLQAQIIMLIEELNDIKEDPSYELAKLSARRPDYLDEVVMKQKVELDKEISELKEKADSLESEIEELNGYVPDDLASEG